VVTQTAVQTGTTIATVEIVAPSTAAVIANGSARLANLSTRGRVTASNPLVVGFAVAGTTPRAVLVRGIGPALTIFGVSEALSSARLQIIDSAGRTIVTN